MLHLANRILKTCAMERSIVSGRTKFAVSLGPDRLSNDPIAALTSRLGPIDVVIRSSGFLTTAAENVLSGCNADGTKVIVKVPVPKSLSSGIWISGIRRRGIFDDDLPFVLFVVGRYGTTDYGDPNDIDAYRRALGDERIPWAVCCFGPREDEVSQYAATAGGHARVGFENNMLMPDGSEAPDNAALVRLAAGHARTVGRQIATADDARSLFL